jgi:hypothetical protein
VLNTRSIMELVAKFKGLQTFVYLLLF